MRIIYNSLFFSAVCLALSSCSTIDDYLLGKDNTPAPAPLNPVHATVNFKEKWSVPVGKATKSATYLKLKPVVRGDTIYTADTSGEIRATNKRNGKTIWLQQLKQKIISGPAIGYGNIAISTDSSSLILLNQEDGKILWRAKVSGDILAKPAITQTKVVAKTIDGNLYAFDIKDGKKLWQSEHGAPHLILKASSSPVIVDKLALVGFSDGKLDAVDLTSGNVAWQRSIAFARGASDIERLVDIDADPIIQGNIAYLATYQGYIGALSLENGQFLWRKPASTYKNIAIDTQNVYMSDSDDTVWALDKKTGQVRWKQVELKARGVTEPVMMGDRIIVGDRGGFLHILSKQTGEIIGRRKMDGPIDIAPTINNQNIFVLTTKGKLNRLAVS